MAKHSVSILDRAIHFLNPFTEDPAGLERPLWRDWSKHNGFVDHGISKANGVLGMAARAAISWGYQDPLFQHNWSGAGIAGLYRTSYHVLYPGQPVVPQADNWWQVHPEIDIVPRIIDLEVDNGVSASRIAEAAWEMSEISLQRDGIRPLIYSRYLLINAWLRSWTPEMLNAHCWVLAQYKFDRASEHPGPPTLPDRLLEERVILHQAADKKAGFPGECQSAAADYDRWELGDAAQMHRWIAENWGGDGPEDPPEEPEVLQYEVEQPDENNVHIHVWRE